MAGTVRKSKLAAIAALFLVFLIAAANVLDITVVDDDPPAPSPSSSAPVTSAPASETPSATPSATAEPTPTSPTASPAEPSPSSSPVPSPSGPVPAVSSWPNQSNTGVPLGTALAASGSITASTAGQVIEAKNITGAVTITAPNVVIRKSKIARPQTGYVVTITGSGSVRIEDSEIVGGTDGIVGNNWTCLRCDIYGFGKDGVKLGNNVLLQDSYVHGSRRLPDAHIDASQMQNGSTNVRLIHNHMDPRGIDGDYGNSAVIIKRDLGGSGAGPVLLERNLFAGGNFTVYVVSGSAGVQQNVTVRDNVWIAKTARFGTHSVKIPVTWTGNRLDNGSALSK